jgi:hypothetical protein
MTSKGGTIDVEMARGDCEAAHPRQKGGEATAQETHAT